MGALKRSLCQSREAGRDRIGIIPDSRLPSSFRDPAGFVYQRGGELYRQVNNGYESDVLHFFQSGLHDELVSKGYITACERMDASLAETPEAAMVLQPERVPLISYPYEWCFSQLKDAALLTLDVALAALEKGMVLKDASAYNIQFFHGKPVHVDTLSFERYVRGEPWIAYAQFCRHFLAPLALMAFVDVRTASLLRNYLDGIPLDLASRLLPWRTRFSPGILLHIHLHSKAVASAERRSSVRISSRISDLRPLIASLRTTIARLNWNPAGSRWAKYGDISNYTPAATESKMQIVREFLMRVNSPSKTCWDLGANTGEFSSIAADLGFGVVAWDSDPSVVEIAYREGRERVLPLLVDLTNPSPPQGWASSERQSFEGRGPVSVVMALAIIHHLAIGNNVPLSMIANFLSSLGEYAITEFVPKSDSQVARMLTARRDIFTGYDIRDFEASMQQYYDIVASSPILESERILYLFKKRA